MKVRIKKVPQARTGYQVRGALANDVPAMGGADYDGYASPETKFNRTLRAVPRDKANLEAEGKETVMMNTGNIPAFYTISGPRHSNGGVPLNLPDDSFIYSDFREMKLKDPDLLAKFGKGKGKAYTPAQISKQYDINKYREILQNPDSDAIDRKTAEIMIRNYNMKLGALALAQEAKKGFPQGIPEVAKPFMEANGLSEEDFVPQEEEEMATEPGMEAEGEEMMAEENQAPETMPDGSPVAMPQGEPIPQEGMMQYGGYPMAMYGMQMGGYDIPYYPNQMAYGGVPRFDNGGGKKRSKTKDELVFKKEKARKEKNAPTGSDWYKTGDNAYSRGSVTVGNLDPMEASSSGGGRFPGNLEQYVDQVCANMKNPKSTGFYMKDPSTFFGTGKAFSDSLPADQKAEILAKLEKCLPAEAYQEEEEHVIVEGTPINEEECVCEYEDGTKSEPMPKDPATGKCPPCPPKEIEEVTGDYGAEIAMPEGYAPWWLQDQVNMVGAMADKASLREYGPYYAAVEMEQPEYEYFDPTRALAAIGEQANIASEASNRFAGSAQQAGARIQNIQGTAAEQAVNTESNYADKNLAAGNQEEAAQVNMRNQENMAKADVANKLYEGKVIADQNMQNAIRAANAAIRMGYNTAVSNRWKTDAMNQMYPDYAVDPSAGGQMYFNPTPKTPNPIKDKDVIAYAQQLEQAGLTKEERAVLLKEYVRSGNASSSGPDPEMLQAMYSQRGGFMKNGGLVYADTVFPFII